MSPLEAPLGYAGQGRPVFPVSARKVSMIADWANAATTNTAIVSAWWTEWPHALIGTPTGKRTGLAVLDIDMKNGVNGFRSLATLGYVDPPRTPTALTPTGGAHLHFQRPEGGFRNTAGAGGRGVGDGLDWRCDGGYVVLPSPGSGYRWGEWTYDNCSPLPVPADLLPREVEPNPYTQAAGVAGRLQMAVTVNSLGGVARCLREAADGERNQLLYWAACRFAEAIAAQLIDADDARRILSKAAAVTGLPDREITKTIISTFGRAAQ